LTWFGLTLSLVGVVPLVGDLAKFIGKNYKLLKESLSISGKLEEVLQGIRAISPDFLDLANVKSLVAEKWPEAVTNGKALWNTALDQLSQWLDNIPDILFAKEQQELAKTIKELRSQSDGMLSGAFGEIKSKIDEILDEIGRLLNPQGELVTPEGVRVPSNGVDEGINDPMRIEGTPGGRGSITPNSALTDQQLIDAVQKGYPNPQHLTELLSRTDLPANIMEQARVNLSIALTSGKYSSDELQGVISQLKGAKTSDEFAEILAELQYPNRVITAGQVATESQVFIGARQGKDYNLGSVTVRTDPVPEADALYLGQDGKIHMAEVKNTTNALRQKLNENPEQLKRLQEWLDKDPGNRRIRLVVETEAGWTNVFAARKRGDLAVLEELFTQGVPLSIGSYDLSVEQMRELWEAVRRKSAQMEADGTWQGWKNFYNQIPTLADAERFLGVSLK
jgi:hypothetical protein